MLRICWVFTKRTFSTQISSADKVLKRIRTHPVYGNRGTVLGEEGTVALTPAITISRGKLTEDANVRQEILKQIPHLDIPNLVKLLDGWTYLKGPSKDLRNDWVFLPVLESFLKHLQKGIKYDDKLSLPLFIALATRSRSHPFAAKVVMEALSYLCDTCTEDVIAPLCSCASRADIHLPPAFRIAACKWLENQCHQKDFDFGDIISVLKSLRLGSTADWNILCHLTNIFKQRDPVPPIQLVSYMIAYFAASSYRPSELCTWIDDVIMPYIEAEVHGIRLKDLGILLYSTAVLDLQLPPLKKEVLLRLQLEEWKHFSSGWESVINCLFGLALQDNLDNEGIINIISEDRVHLLRASLPNIYRYRMEVMLSVLNVAGVSNVRSQPVKNENIDLRERPALHQLGLLLESLGIKFNVQTIIPNLKLAGICIYPPIVRQPVSLDVLDSATGLHMVVPYTSDNMRCSYVPSGLLKTKHRLAVRLGFKPILVPSLIQESRLEEWLHFTVLS